MAKNFEHDTLCKGSSQQLELQKVLPFLRGHSIPTSRYSEGAAAWRNRLRLLLHWCLDKRCKRWVNPGRSQGPSFTSSFRIFLPQWPPWPQIVLIQKANLVNISGDCMILFSNTNKGSNPNETILSDINHKQSKFSNEPHNLQVH